MILAAMATGHPTHYIAWHMSMVEVRQAASIYLHVNGTAMRSPVSTQVDPEIYRVVMGYD